MKWLRYSGMTLMLVVNPLHWAWRPELARYHDEWAGPRERTITARWLMLTIRVWIDDGSW